MKTLCFALLAVGLMVMVFSGCATTPPGVRPQGHQETPREAISAMQNVLTTVSGEKVDEAKLRELNHDIQKDPQAQSAVAAMAHSLSGEKPKIKYCPLDGQRYSYTFAQCPVHHVPLKILDGPNE